MVKVRLGTRGSKLALIQANHVKSLLEEHHKDIDVELVIITTSGDWKPEHGEKALSQTAGGKGLFIKEIERALLNNEIDAGVHSLKDVPAELPEGFKLSQILEREDPMDALISKDHQYKTLDDLPAGAVIGTSSMRRSMFALSKRPDCRVEVLRGNVDTRLQKLAAGQVDATFLAVAGLKRMGLQEHISGTLSAESMLPCAGQGAVALEIREDDHELDRLLAPLNHEETALRCKAERAVCRALNASCHTPLGVFAHRLVGHPEIMMLNAALGIETGRLMFKAFEQAHVTNVEEAEYLGHLVAESLSHDTPADVQSRIGVRFAG
jgi:hydroxymethylbilane synthase